MKNWYTAANFDDYMEGFRSELDDTIATIKKYGLGASYRIENNDGIEERPSATIYCDYGDEYELCVCPERYEGGLHVTLGGNGTGPVFPLSGESVFRLLFEVAARRLSDEV